MYRLYGLCADLPGERHRPVVLFILSLSGRTLGSGPNRLQGRDPMDPIRSGLTLARNLTLRGFPTVLVGGAVRDLLLGLPPRDADLATAAPPDSAASEKPPV